jgi:GDP-fucose protein O-fucosyltransferase
LKQVEAIRKKGQQEQKKHNKQQPKHQRKQVDDTNKMNTKNGVASKLHQHKDGIDIGSNFAYPWILNCDQYGSPSADIPQEMVYWKELPYDQTIISSPLRHPQEEQFITFEIDGGWNNVRMGFETVVAMAIATGRTLVLPPRQQIWGVVDTSREHHLAFDDFFPLLLSQTKSCKVISFNEFITNVVLCPRQWSHQHHSLRKFGHLKVNEQLGKDDGASMGNCSSIGSSTTQHQQRRQRNRPPLHQSSRMLSTMPPPTPSGGRSSSKNIIAEDTEHSTAENGCSISIADSRSSFPPHNQQLPQVRNLQNENMQQQKNRKHCLSDGDLIWKRCKDNAVKKPTIISRHVHSFFNNHKNLLCDYSSSTWTLYF